MNNVIHSKEGNKESTDRIKPSNSVMDHVGIPDFNEHESIGLDRSVIENLSKYEPNSVSPTIYFKKHYSKKLSASELICGIKTI